MVDGGCCCYCHRLRATGLQGTLPPKRSPGCCAATAAGSGLGLRATADLHAGDLILISPPLAVVYGANRAPPPNQALVAALRRSLSSLGAAEARWVRLLRGGHGSSSDVPQALLQEAQELLLLPRGQLGGEEQRGPQGGEGQLGAVSGAGAVVDAEVVAEAAGYSPVGLNPGNATASPAACATAVSAATAIHAPAMGHPHSHAAHFHQAACVTAPVPDSLCYSPVH